MGFVRTRSVLLCFCAVTALLATSAKSEVLASLNTPEVQPFHEGTVRQDKPAAAGVSIPSLPDVEISLPVSGPEQTEVSAAPEQGMFPEATLIPTFSFPPLPEAKVIFTARDMLANALAVHLADHGDGKGLRLSPRLPKDTRQSIAEFYERTAFQPLWIDHGKWTAAALSLRAQLAKATDDALDPADYPVPALNDVTDQEALAQAELMLSASAILYARDARGGRIVPERLSKNITPELDLPAVPEILTRLAATPDAGTALQAYNPQHPGYLALKNKLAEIRQAMPKHAVQEVPRGPTLKVGMRDERVPLIRARLGIEPGDEQDIYDETVAAAVAGFQQTRGLKASGNFNDQTVAALVRSSEKPQQVENDIIANMERWRWLPHQLGSKYILVNVPEYELRVVENGNLIRQARVIVGKSQSPTPIFSGNMQNIVVNPYWTIPPSILKNEVLPGMARDPGYAEKRGYQVTRSRNGNITVRQPPGERNALGRIKFLFPNQHAVYLHDTPSRGLFSAKKRAFSHGCVRVDNPFAFAEEILGKDKWPETKMRGMIGKGERHIKLEDPLPVHMTYFTLSVDDNGQIQRFDDIYGFNRRVLDALGLKG